jgi:mitogen-activated protein kinase kinase 9
MTMAPPEPEPSDYDWIGELGEGGFARVSKVRYRRTGEVFALKEAFYPSPDAHEEGEVLRRAAGYASAYVVRYHAVFLDPDGGLSSVLELMDAGSLFSVLRRRGDHGFREPALAEVATRCLMGLAQLHSRGVAHLDVKPENFLANAEGEIKVNDFNAAPARGSVVVRPNRMGVFARNKNLFTLLFCAPRIHNIEPYTP